MFRIQRFIGGYKNIRSYQTRTGVYGYKPRSPNKFELSEETLSARNANSNVFRWIEAYRSQGHLVAGTNPVEFNEEINRDLAALKPSTYGLSLNDEVNLQNLLQTNESSASVEKLKATLDEIYCGTVSAEFSYISCEAERHWITENYENIFQQKLTNEDKKEIAELMLKSQGWDHFLAAKFPTVKRYGGEGNESFFAFFRQLFLSGVNTELQGIVLGMPHRGRLNLLTVLLNTRPAKIFNKFRGLSEFPAGADAVGDIAGHFHVSEDLTVNGQTLHVNLLNNPSHLEAVNPVSMGKTRSKQQRCRDGAFNDDAAKPFGEAYINVQLHGDAALPGQGINQESIFLQGTPNYEVGGTIHLVVNNQVGFTTPSDRAKCSRYCTDLAKSIEAPVFHVNGDDPERLTLVTKLAFEYRKKFQKDIFIDLNCFRRWGHNELDDPTFTNPALYKIIHQRKSIPDLYADKLMNENILSLDEKEKIIRDFNSFLTEELNGPFKPEEFYFKKQWFGLKQPANEVTRWDTGLDWSILNLVGQNSVHIPADFKIHPHLQKTHVVARMKRISDGQKIDWATAEALAFGSLMYQGYNVRLSGEDIGRGTFSHRHAMLVDQNTNDMFIPLNSMKGGNGGKLELAHTILSEEAVLGFEYGYAIDNPNNLVIWEAQFGDFFNGAQIIFDTFIVSSETKWMAANGLVILLPHGMDGACSEHSSARIERFLQMTNSKETTPDGDNVNFQVANPTTPAQYFHILRRQLIRDFRKPLVLIAPKTLLRLSDATSSYTEFISGTTFEPVLADPTVSDPKAVKKVILCSGKHYYNLQDEKVKRKDQTVAVIRVESLCPFPVHEIQEELSKYKNAKSFIWSQEEHRNMGAWSFVQPRFENMCGHRIQYSGRSEGATPAVGISSWHKKEVEQILNEPFEMK